jgi:AcrR family transcriptional regulator
MADERARSTLERREEVLAAAAECFMRRGYDATTMDHVAEMLGATKGRVYHHFTSKPELFFAVWRRAMELVYDAILPHATTDEPGGERLAAMARAHALCMMEKRPFQRTLSRGVDLYRLGETSAENTAILKVLMDQRRDYELLFRRVTQAGVDDGSLAVPDARIATRSLLGALNWVTVWYEPRPGETRADRERLADQIVQTVLQGFGAARGG